MHFLFSRQFTSRQPVACLIGMPQFNPVMPAIHWRTSAPAPPPCFAGAARHLQTGINVGQLYFPWRSFFTQFMKKKMPVSVPRLTCFLYFQLKRTSPCLLLSLFSFSREAYAYSIFNDDFLNLLRMGKIFEPSGKRTTFNKGFNIVKSVKKFPKKNVFTAKISGILSWSRQKYCVRIRPFHKIFHREINLPA